MNNKNAPLYFLNEGGDMGKHIRAKDWSKTPLGDARDWPISLKTMVSVMLENPIGMYIAWGRDYTQLYNDAYLPILGTKHPNALGLSSKETFLETWHNTKPIFDRVMDGHPLRISDQMLPINRNGCIVECYFDFTHSPIRIENGDVGGILITVTDTTNTKSAENKYKLSANQLQFAIEATGLATWSINPVTKKVHWK
ncbi:PAS domain-containing protein [Formosa algae]|uniref:PAS domain-containing protein n=1 Tax=Formosa algae TaxID=225843 RepID=UPI000CCEB82D|nr:PAS domain-containing protein [Formosa algae]PNW28069.1 hypothetical protein BKP44_10490 [Formosa algae]